MTQTALAKYVYGLAGNASREGRPLASRAAREPVICSRLYRIVHRANGWGVLIRIADATPTACKKDGAPAMRHNDTFAVRSYVSLSESYVHFDHVICNSPRSHVRFAQITRAIRQEHMRFAKIISAIRRDQIYNSPRSKIQFAEIV